MCASLRVYVLSKPSNRKLLNYRQIRQCSYFLKDLSSLHSTGTPTPRQKENRANGNWMLYAASGHHLLMGFIGWANQSTIEPNRVTHFGITGVFFSFACVCLYASMGVFACVEAHPLDVGFAFSSRFYDVAMRWKRLRFRANALTKGKLSEICVICCCVLLLQIH